MVSLGNFREHPLRIALGDFIFDRIWQHRPSLIFCICGFTVACSLLLGGVAQAGELSDALIELFAIPCLLVALSSLVDLPAWKTGLQRDAFWGLVLCCTIVTLPLIQLVPLPAWLWTALRGRQKIVDVFQMLGGRLPWMPISVLPGATWLSFLALLPPIAIFVAAIQLSYRERRRLVQFILAVAVVSVFLGLVQLAQGPQSSLRFYAYTNRDDAVGFFANRNHFAALLYVALMFVSVWAIDLSFRFASWSDLRGAHHLSIVTATVVFLVCFVLLIGEAVSRSRAGVGLTMVALLGAFALTLVEQKNRSKKASSKILFVTVCVVVIVVLQFGLYRILERSSDPLLDARTIFAKNTIHAAWAFMPFGSGLGSFVPVYQMFEKPPDTLADVYVNHAHNDYLELWLETGIMGVVVFCLFGCWFGRQCSKLWRSDSTNASPLDLMLARAATMVVALLLLHSLVDFSMQTEAIMAVFAASCALLVGPCRRTGDETASETHREFATRKSAAAARSSIATGSLLQPLKAPETRQVGDTSPAGRWGDDVEWPEEWQTTQKTPPSSGPGKAGRGDT